MILIQYEVLDLYCNALISYYIILPMTPRPFIIAPRAFLVAPKCFLVAPRSFLVAPKQP